MLTSGTLTHEYNGSTLVYSLNLSALNLTVGSSAAINADAKGYTGGARRGHCFSGAGGGYGGYGGSASDAGSGVYGSVTQPVDIGTGGHGSCDCTWGTGGSGGGAIRIDVRDMLTVDGAISASGGTGGGGGSGGSIWITTGTLTGSSSGAIRANGGYSPAGGGGGGRVAVYYTTNTLAGAITAYGSSAGNQAGGAGTVYMKASSQAYGDLIINNNNISGALTPITSAIINLHEPRLDNLIIDKRANVDINLPQIRIGNLVADNSSSTTMTLATPLRVNNFTVDHSAYLDLGLTGRLTITIDTLLLIQNSATLVHRANAGSAVYDFNITAPDAIITSGGTLSANGRGYAGWGTRGHCFAGAGGGYGGVGVAPVTPAAAPTAL